LFKFIEDFETMKPALV